ncbi:hypothetical protein [Sphingobacterium sp.]|uniref:hypothetical protein n=1 Tax=Sphingobacterium sp. TaxID=341027 RepID=UPI0025D43E9B|nr:hypothetical protein [Sphingobacterium sp.]
MVRTIYFYIFFFLIVSCSVRRQLPTLQLKENDSERLLLNGYYYTKLDSVFFDVIFLYKNGIVYQGGNPDIKDGFKNIDETFSQSYINDKKTGYIWGLYIVDGNHITIERYLTPIYAEKYQTYVDKGHVVNERKFIITSRKYIKTGKLEARRDTFNFRPLSIKPDSTNNFIK